jgi:uricase-like protein
MGEGVLRAYPEIAEIRFSMPNKHHFLVDLSKWGLDNPHEVWHAADRPYGSSRPRSCATTHQWRTACGRGSRASCDSPPVLSLRAAW